MITFTPDGDPIHERNDCHEPAGSPKGGQFCGSKMGMADLARGARAYQRRNAERRAIKRERLDAMLRRARKPYGNRDWVGIAAMQRRLTALGEAEEFPEGFTPLEEANDCHEPAGRPTGGQFCSKGQGMDRVWLDNRLGRETVGEYVARHKLEVTPGGRIVMYHGRPKGSTYTTLRAGSYLGENPKESAYYAARDRDLSSAQVEVLRLEIDPNDFEPGSFATMRHEVSIADMQPGAGAHLYGPGTLTSHDRAYVDRRAHLQPRANELAGLLGAQLPGWQVSSKSQGALHTVTATDPDGIHIDITLDVGRPDQPWDRVQVTGAYGGIVSTLRWKTGGTVNVKKLAQIAKDLVPLKREVLAKIRAARGNR